MADHTKIVVQLRGEIGEIVHSWILLRHFLAARSDEVTDDPKNDMENRNLWFVNSLIDKLESDIISRLSELAEPVRRGRINFENAKSQLNRVGLCDCASEIHVYREFVKHHGFEDKRNCEISHKEFLIEWQDERGPIRIPYNIKLRAIALAIRAMKRIDTEVYGDIHGKFMWRALREGRYTSTMLPRAMYVIAEHIRLPEWVRARIVMQEIHEGKFCQDLMDVEVNGVKVQVYASKKWGAVNLGGQLIMLPEYPLQSLEKIEGENIVVDPAWSQSSSGEDQAMPGES